MLGQGEEKHFKERLLEKGLRLFNSVLLLFMGGYAVIGGVLAMAAGSILPVLLFWVAFLCFRATRRVAFIENIQDGVLELRTIWGRQKVHLDDVAYLVLSNTLKFSKGWDTPPNWHGCFYMCAGPSRSPKLRGHVTSGNRILFVVWFDLLLSKPVYLLSNSFMSPVHKQLREYGVPYLAELDIS